MAAREQQTVLITGLNGFVGHHLAHELVSAGHTVLGASREDELATDLKGVVETYYPVDLGDAEAIEKLPWSGIDSVVHLAGLANAGTSFDNPKLYMDVNVSIIENLFAAASESNAHPRVIAVSSGAVYGRTSGAVTEGSDLDPSNPYAQSKLAAERIVTKYRDHGFDDATTVRPFNHVGPGQRPGFLVPDLGEQIAAGKNPVKAGNLSSSRDYTDVRDVARAYRLLIEAPILNYEVYNVCSGQSIKGEDIFRMLKAAADKPDLSVEVESKRLRSNDEDNVVGSNQRLKDQTGWQPEIPIEQTLKDYMDWVLSRD